MRVSEEEMGWCSCVPMCMMRLFAVTWAVEPGLKFKSPARGIQIIYLRVQNLHVFGSGSGTMRSNEN